MYFARPVDIGENKWVLDGADLDPIDGPTKHALQSSGEAEDLFKGRQVSVGFEIDQKVCVANSRLTPRRHGRDHDDPCTDCGAPPRLPVRSPFVALRRQHLIQRQQWRRLPELANG